MDAKPYVLSVSAFVLGEEGKVLLLQRAEASKHFALAWEVPGGKAESSESIDQALLREVKEETGLNVCMSDFELAHVHVCVLYFKTHIRDSKVQLSDEHMDFAWVRWDAMNKWQLTPACNLPEGI